MLTVISNSNELVGLEGMDILACFGCRKKTVDDIRTLDYGSLGLTEVPPEVFNFERTLETLYLEGNKIMELPRMLFQCEELRHLDLSDNEIQSIPALISKLVNLQTLNMNRNCLKYSDIPNNIHRCQKLTFLDLSSNALDKLSEGLTSLVNLHELYLNDTYLEFLPANFGRLCNLRILELRDNNLSTLPKSLRRLTALVRLDLSNNDLTVMPEVIENMHNLRELWLNGNCIVALLSTIGNLIHLQDFDVSKNELDTIPGELGNCVSLVTLTLTQNLIRTVPAEIGKLKHLQTLKVDFNCVESLPYSLGECAQLEELDVQNNQLVGLPASVGLLRRLNCLVASHNYLSALPSEIGNCVSLTILNLHHNRLRRMPDEIGRLQQLRTLGLIGNELEYLPITVAHLPQLRALWLSQNQSHPLIPLQSELYESSGTSTNGQMVLTCFLLPQQQPHNQHLRQPSPPMDTEVTTPLVTKQRHIAFLEPGENGTEDSNHSDGIAGDADRDSDDNGGEGCGQQQGTAGRGVRAAPSSRLSRAPTPYPKDFQRYQRSLSNQLLRKGSAAGLGGQISSGTLVGGGVQMTGGNLTGGQLSGGNLVGGQLSSNSLVGGVKVMGGQMGGMGRVDHQVVIREAKVIMRNGDGVVGRDPVKEHDTYGTQTDFTSPDSAGQGDITTTDNIENVTTPLTSTHHYDNTYSTYHKQSPNHYYTNDGHTNNTTNLSEQQQTINKQQPPPYHIAAVYSKNAKYFNKVDTQTVNSHQNNISVSAANKTNVDRAFLQELNEKLLLNTTSVGNKQQPPQLTKQLVQQQLTQQQLVQQQQQLTQQQLVQQNQQLVQKQLSHQQQQLQQQHETVQSWNYDLTSKNSDSGQLPVVVSDCGNNGANNNSKDYELYDTSLKSNTNTNQRRSAVSLTIVLTPCCYVLGFSVSYNETGVFVNKVDENGNAFNKLFPGDRILQLDSLDLTAMEPWQAYKTILIQGPETETFHITRY